MDPDTLAALDDNYVEANRIFACTAERGEFLERKDVAIVSCGLPVEQLNWGFLKPPHDGVGEAAAWVRRYFSERKLPFKLSYRGEGKGFGEALAAGGWHRKAELVPGMALALPAAIPAPPAALAIREVRTTEALDRYREAAFRGFGFPAAAARFFLDARILALPQVRLYAGLVDGVVCATSMLVASGAVAGIYWVATIDEQRRRGFGEALTWAAVAGGRAQGCTVASLQASTAGRPVYARMGFAHVLDYESLHPPVS